MFLAQVCDKFCGMHRLDENAKRRGAIGQILVPYSNRMIPTNFRALKTGKLFLKEAKQTRLSLTKTALNAVSVEIFRKKDCQRILITQAVAAAIDDALCIRV